MSSNKALGNKTEKSAKQQVQFQPKLLCFFVKQ